MTPRTLALVVGFTLGLTVSRTHAQQLPTPPPDAAAPSATTRAASPNSGTQSTENLEKLVAPIALYPDVVLAQVLPASTVPLQVVDAARYAEKNRGKTTPPAGKNWEPPVVGLLAYPDALKKINEDLDWLQRLGDAVIEQQAAVMDAIQKVRQRVNDAGGLPSNDKQTVVDENEVIKIVPADPQVVYVPTYDSDVIYVDDDDDYVGGGWMGFGLGMTIGIIIGDDCDWDNDCIWHHGYGDVDINIDEINIDRDDINADRERPGSGSGERSQWKPSTAAKTEHQARGQAQARARNGAPGVQPANVSAAQRAAQDRGRGVTSTGAGGAGGAGARPAQPAAGTRPSTGAGGAFDDSRTGSAARRDSSRGNASRGVSRPSSGARSGGARGGGGRGGGRR